MSDWPIVQLREVAELITKGATPTTYGMDYVESGVTFVRVNNITDEGRLALSDCLHVDERTHALFARSQLKVGDVLLTIAGSIGRSAVVDESALPANCNQAVALIRLKKGAEPGFVARLLSSPLGKSKIEAATVQLAQANFSLGQIGGLAFRLPGVAEQKAITRVLDSFDTTIRQTEAIIEKLKQVKQGLLHDLLTRGIDSNGELRPPQSQAPHLYKESPLGWTPKEWRVLTLAEASESVVDGPFGSNLKTEHYVHLPGVRVVRLQNVGIGAYDDSERAFVSAMKAKTLARNEVVPGDVLVAALGDERHPIGRACCYPSNLPPAINKADCFRLRTVPEVAIGAFVMWSLNGASARRQLRGFEQGVTMQRVNLGNLKRVKLALPAVDEQKASCKMLEALDQTLVLNTASLAKAQKQKSGLMHDLLTGRVRVTPLLDPASP